MTGHRPLRSGSGSGWGAALRIARREMLRAKGRSVLVLLMVLLPLTAVVGLDTLLRTSDVDAVERLPRELGDAQARIVAQGGGPVVQSPDGEQTFTGSAVPPGPAPTLDEDDLRALLPGARLLAVREARGERPVRTMDGRTARVALLAADLTDPAVRGPYGVLRGSAPDRPGQVAVTPALARFGFPLGSRMRLPDGTTRTVTGVVRSPEAYGSRLSVVGLPADVGLAGSRPLRFYASGPEVTWSDVQALNALGAVVLSRSVVLDPPPDDQVTPPPYGDGQDAVTAAIVGLITVIAVLEVVLLAGPAFAVGARRQRRALALMAAGGAEPRHVRRVVLAQGLLVGGVAAGLALVLGVGGAALLREPVRRYGDAYTDGVWGPFEVSVRDLALLCLLGAGTALLAALAPAVLAARQPVVAALQGRRVAAGRRWLPTAVGVVLLVVGVLSCARSLQRGFPELWVAAAAVPTVLGAAALAPLLLAAAGRLAPRLPLPLRFAVRDADRQRGRTAPAVAAVTAVVAGVVALATAAGSDGAGERASFTPTLPGTAVVSVYSGAADLPALAQAAREALPGEPVTLVRGIPLAATDPRDQRVLNVCRPAEPAAPSCNGFGVGQGMAFGTNALVGPQVLDVLAADLTPSARARAERDLAAGRALVAGAPRGAAVELRLQDGRYDERTGQDRSVLVREVALEAAPLPPLPSGALPAGVVLPEQAAQRLGGATPVSVLVGTDLDRDEEERLQRAVQHVDTGASAHVERLPRDETETVVLLLGLAAGLLVVGGSLAATSLALTEAGPDLATLGQVGAHPRTRRLVAASYGFVLALVGAVLGCLAGLVPGVAGAAALTRGEAYVEHPDGRSVRYGAEPLGQVDVPWLLLIGLVVLLPLLTGLVAGLTTRSSLPGLGRRVRA